VYNKRGSFYLDQSSYVRSLGGRAELVSTVAISNRVFHYLSLDGDTVIPDGLHTKLCHAFLVFFLILYEWTALMLLSTHH